MKEPTIAEAIKDIYLSGEYTTFMYEHRNSVERATSGSELARLFLRHVLAQGVQRHVAGQLRERCKPILDEARQKGCLFFKCRFTYWPRSLRLTFNNGVDVQYTRSLGFERLLQRYGVIVDTVYLKTAVQSFFLYQDDIKSLRHGLSRKSR